jgi:hypothetical protein
MLLQPALQEAFPGRPVSVILLALILFSAMYAIVGTGSGFYVAPAIVVATLLAFSISDSRASLDTLPWIYVGWLAVLIYAVAIVLLDVLRARSISSDTVCGAVCVYFLLGLTWGILYAILELANPGSFYFAPFVQIESVGRWREFEMLQALIGFSFVTPTTTGYGDIVPTMQSVRSVAVVEAATGQLYIAIMIARLVSLQVGGSSGGSGARHGDIR